MEILLKYLGNGRAQRALCHQFIQFKYQIFIYLQREIFSDIHLYNGASGPFFGEMIQ